MLIQAFSRTAPTIVGFGYGGVPWREVPQQRPAAYVLFVGVDAAVQMLASEKITVHRPHDTVQHVARAVRLRMTVGREPELFLGTQILDCLRV